DWIKGTNCVYRKKGEKRVFDMDTKKPLALEDVSENDESEVTTVKTVLKTQQVEPFLVLVMSVKCHS
ncbi:hypothetical protein GOP47_0031011, partial [Adiantum capillus-veneris]